MTALQGEPSEVSKTVWIVNHYAGVPSNGQSGSRHLNLALEISKLGWSPSLILATTVHPSGRQTLRGPHLRRITEELDVPTLWIRANSYESGQLARFVGMAVFAANLVRPGATTGLEDPDVVIGSTVHPLAAWAASVLARRHGVPFVFEVRDIWPETLVQLGAISPDGIAERITRRLMRSLVLRSELVISPLPFVDRWLEGLGSGDKPFVWISNGTDADSSSAPAAVPSHEHFTFMYLGSHGQANAIDQILDAFDDARQNRPDLDLRLRLVGDGPLKRELIEHASTLPSAHRIFFEDRVPATAVESLTLEADAMIAVLHDLPLYEYGIGLNKLFTYLNSGRPTVWASSAPNNPVREARAGICSPGDDREALSQAIIEMATTAPDERLRMAVRGRKHVQDNYTFDTLGKKLASSLDAIVGRRLAVRPTRAPRFLDNSSER